MEKDTHSNHIHHNKHHHNVMKKKIVYTYTQQLPRRVDHPLILYILVLLAQVFSFILSILYSGYLILQVYYMISFYSSFVRISIWFANSIYLTKGINWQLVKYYTPLDVLTLLGILTSYCYYSLNLIQHYDSQNTYFFPSIVMYAINLFFITGNFRTMIYTVIWSRLRVIIYKFIRILTIVAYLYSGINQMLIQQKDPNAQKDELLVLYIFTTLGFLSQSVNRMSKIDGSDKPYGLMYNFDDGQQL